eukprot:6092068-Amphidinium_carterae.1
MACHCQLVGSSDCECTSQGRGQENPTIWGNCACKANGSVWASGSLGMCSCASVRTSYGRQPASLVDFCMA